MNTLFYNGNFWTSAQKRFNWLLSDSEGKISELGKGKPPKNLFFIQKINLKNKYVMPGWIDSHVHLVNMGLREVEVDVSVCKNPKELFSFLKNHARNNEWIEAYGLNTENWASSIDAKFLDRISSHIPIFIRRVDEHAAWVNSVVLKKIHSQSQGFLVDQEMEEVLKIKPKPSQGKLEKALLKAQKNLIESGITSVHDMSTHHSHVMALANLMKQQKYDLRVSCALYGEAVEKYLRPQSHLYKNHLNIRAKKIFIDGSLGSHGAWLSQEYKDRPQWRGSCLQSGKKMLKIIQFALQKDFQLIFHVLGDQASLWVLDILNSHFEPTQIKNKRFRFEHMEVIHPKAYSLMKKFGIIASLQPWHAISDGPWLKKRLSKELLSCVSPIKNLISKKIVVCGGSDAPIETHNPLWGIHASQKISICEAIKMYTHNAAFAEFSEDLKGSLEQGKLADFVVYPKDILEMKPKYFLKVKPSMTVIGGKVVYCDKN